MSQAGNQHNKEHDELKARVRATEHALAIVAQMLHTLHQGDLKLGGGETERLLKLVKAMPGGDGVIKTSN